MPGVAYESRRSVKTTSSTKGYDPERKSWRSVSKFDENWRRQTPQPEERSPQSVPKLGQIYMSDKGTVVLTPEQRELTGSRHPWGPQPQKCRPYLIVGRDVDGKVRAVPLTTRAKKGWDGMTAEEQEHFLPIGCCQEGVSRPLVNVSSTPLGSNGTSFFHVKSLVWLDVVETFAPQDLSEYCGEIENESLLLVFRELARVHAVPRYCISVPYCIGQIQGILRRIACRQLRRETSPTGLRVFGRYEGKTHLPSNLAEPVIPLQQTPPPCGTLSSNMFSVLVDLAT